MQTLIESTSNAFKIILPNINRGEEKEKNSSLDDSENKVLQFTKKHGSITRSDAEKQLGVSASTASRVLKRIAEKGLLLQQGKGKSTKYIIPM